MLIGLQRRFIFVSNLKSASTAIEMALKPVSEIAILEPADAKHLPLRSLLARFKWLLDPFNLEEFLIFGVIRDPVEFVISLYNSHRKDAFKANDALYTGNLNFQEFIEKWTKRRDYTLAEQHVRFLDDQGNIGANYIISYNNLTEGLQYVGARLNRPNLANMKRYNESPSSLLRHDLSESQIKQIKQRFLGDYRFMAQFCDRLLSLEERRLSASKNSLASPRAVGASTSSDSPGITRPVKETIVNPPINREEVKRFVASHRWFHSIDLGDGIVTPGGKTLKILDAESSDIFGGVDVRGHTVMDVGAWNGYYTVELKRRGASRVLAVDSPTWLQRDLRGKETFDFVMKRLGLTVETLVLDVQTIDIELVGSWDIVLFLGVFYHLIDPIAAVTRLAEIANEVLVLETHLDARDYDRPAMVYYPGRELSNDPTNWWGPNRAAVEALLRTAGFKHVHFAAHPLYKVRGIFHAYKSDEAFQRHSVPGKL